MVDPFNSHQQLPRPQLTLIAAVDIDGGYCKAGKIPWDLPEDMKWFQQTTKGHICVMGRTTYEDMNAIVGDRGTSSVLPGRECYVVSSTVDSLPNATVIRTLRDIEKHVDLTDQRTIFVLGGKQLFDQAIARASNVLLTVIARRYECDKFFPVEYLTKHFAISAVTDSSDPDMKFFEYTRRVPML